MARIAIVGGGIAGMYCAFNLLKKDHKVILYEALGRLGGRIETKDMQGGFKAECGPMRFEKAIETHFQQLIEELEIVLDDFTPPVSGIAEYPKFDLSLTEFSAKQKQAVAALGSDAASNSISGLFSHNTSALDLLKYGVYRIFHEGAADRALTLADVVVDWDGNGDKPLDKITVFANSYKVPTDYDRIRTHTRLDRVPLHLLGFWNALSRVLSPAAVAKIRDTGTFYHLMPENPSASEWSIFWLRLFRSDANLSTIKAGVSTIVDKLEILLKSSENFDLRLGVSVKKVELARYTDKLFLFAQDSPQANIVDHVIFAIPTVPLRVFSRWFPDHIQDLIEGVIPFPLLKVFIVVEDPWWTDFPQPQQGAHLVPTREVHFFPPNEGQKSAMVMFYMDRPATAYWQPLIDPPHHEAQMRSPDALKHEIAIHASKLLPKPPEMPDIDHVRRVQNSIIDFAIRDWAHLPFGAACHAWRPKIDVPDALYQLQAFSLDVGNPNVHICGEAYSDYQGFIEGALQSACDVLKTIPD